MVTLYKYYKYYIILYYIILYYIILYYIINDIESRVKEARMYETETQDNGYTALKLYLQKVNPKCTALFQYPKKTSTTEDAIWYEALPLGIKSLAKMMKTISEEAGLSKHTQPFSLVQRRDIKPSHHGHFRTWQ